MDVITKAQRKALKQLFDRSPLYLYDGKPSSIRQGLQPDKPMTYRQFRELAGSFHTDFIMVPWCGMWLGIETDGYTHS